MVDSGVNKQKKQEKKSNDKLTSELSTLINTIFFLYEMFFLIKTFEWKIRLEKEFSNVFVMFFSFIREERVVNGDVVDGVMCY